MSIVINAINCPLPQAPVGMLSTSDPPPTGYLFVDGSTPSAAQFNQNVTRAAIIGRYGGAAGYAVVYGLDFTFGASLTLTVNAGQAMIDGIVQLPAQTATVPDGFFDAQNPVWIWLVRVGNSGVITHTITTTAPAGAVVLLGSVTTSGGIITNADYSGVVYLRGGVLFRQTADIGPPTDTPPAITLVTTLTKAGTHQWDGTEHRFVGTNITGEAYTLTPGQGGNIPAGRQVNQSGAMTITGALTINGRLILKPDNPTQGTVTSLSKALQAHLQGDVTLTGSGGVTVTQSGQNLDISTVVSGVLPATLLQIAGGSAGITWTVPVASTEFNGKKLYRVKFDASSGFTQARIMVDSDGFPANNAVLVLKYSTNNGSTWNAADGASGPTVTLAADGLNVGAWVTLTGAALADVQWAIFGSDSTGPVASVFGTITAQLK